MRPSGYRRVELAFLGFTILLLILMTVLFSHLLSSLSK